MVDKCIKNSVNINTKVNKKYRQRVYKLSSAFYIVIIKIEQGVR
jgi:hypothetical protein